MTVRSNQQAQTDLLQQILTALGDQAAGQAQLGAIAASLARIEQFVAPAGQANPTGPQAGIAHDLRRLTLLMTGPSSTPVGSTYGRDVFVMLMQDALDAWTGTASNAARLADAIWPVGEERPGSESDTRRSLYWLIYRLMYWIGTEYPRPEEFRAVGPALWYVNDTLEGLYNLNLQLNNNIGTKVQDLTAIDWLARIAGCACQDLPPAPGIGGCASPEVSTGVRSSDVRTYAVWGGTGPIFGLGVVSFAEGSSAPVGTALTSEVWSVLSIYVASSRAAYWSTTGEDGTMYPTNQWLAVPADDGGNLIVAVGLGQDVVAYLCSEAAQPPPPETGWLLLNSAGGTVLDADGVPYIDPQFGSYGFAINEWYRLTYNDIPLSSRQKNSESGFTHVMTPGSYVDLPVAYEMYSISQWNLYQGAAGLVQEVASQEHVVIGPATNVSCAWGGSNFVLYIRVAPPS